LNILNRFKYAFTRKAAWVFVPLFLVAAFVPPVGPATPAHATFSTNTQISDSQGFLQGEFAEVGVRANGAFGSTSVPSGFHANPANCLGFRVDREMDGWGSTTDDGDYFCPGSPFEGWQMKVAGGIAKNDNSQTGLSGAVSDIQNSGSSQCVSWISASPYNGVSVSQRYCVPTSGQALHTDVTLTNTTGSAVSDIYFGRGFDPDNATGSGSMTCAGSTAGTNMFQSCNAVTGQGTEAQATARWGNNSFIALQSFDARARVARQAGGFSSPDPSDIWTAGNTLATSGTYLGNVGEILADAGIYVALNVPTLGAGASTSFRISYVLSADGNNAPVLGAPVVSGIGQTSATVASTVNPKGFSTTAALVYSTDSSFATSSSVSMGTLTGSDEVAIDAEITGLDPSETYYAKIVATNETGTTESAVFDFDTLAATAPIVSSEEPTVTVDDGPVTLSGTLNPNGFSSTAVFQYSTTADFSGTVVDVPVSGTFTGTSLSSVSTVVSGLTGSTAYYFRLKVTNASGSAYGSTMSFVPNDIPAPTSLVVTSLDDTTSSGTLRWAITQANATSGGIYDSITFGVNGTVTLSSALPQITQNVTITGNGRTQTIIDGNNLYRIFNVPSGRSLTVSDMTLKQGQNIYGGLIYNSQGTVIATNLRFTAMTGGSAVWNNAAGSRAVYTNCTFDYLSIGIGGDHGSTPQLPTGVTTWADQADSVFQNRTYVDNCVFSNNDSGINTQRFTKVQNSTFTNNSYAVNIQGLNRGQVLNSTFTGNGIGVYHNGWIPASFNMGTDNRLISGNTFTNNSIAIYLDDTNTSGQKYQGWSTVVGNAWDANGVWVRYYQWNGTTNAEGTARPYTTGTVFAQSSNTFPDTISAPSNLTATDTGTGIFLDWDAPVGGGYLPERYAISWSGSLGGGGIATGNVGGANALNTSIEIPYSVIYSFGEEGEIFPFHIRSDNDTFSKYSANSNVVSIQVGVSTSTTTTSTTTTTEVVSTTTEPVVVVVPVEPEPETTVPEDTTPTTEETLPEETETTTTEPETTTTEPETESTEPPVDTLPDETTDFTDEEIINIIDSIDTTSSEEVAAVLDDIFTSDISAEQLTEVLDAVFTADVEAEVLVAALDAVLSADISTEEFAAVLDAVFDEPLSDEQFTAVIDSVITEDITDEQFAEVLNVLESDTVSEEQVAEAVDAVLENGVTEDQATDLASSSKVLESIDTTQAEAVFETIPVGDLTQVEEAALVAAVTDAPQEIKETFEETIDIYGEGLDDYVAVGSQVDVGSRRTLIAATTAVAAVAGAAATGGASGGSTGGSGGSSGGGSSSSSPEGRSRREEEGEEPAGEIAGPEDEDDEELTRNSIFNYYLEEGIWKRKISWLGLIRKFVNETAALSFTLAGSVVVFITLSGDTRKTAMIATGVALAVHYIHVLLKNDEA
jgi:hypothetical protein